MIDNGRAISSPVAHLKAMKFTKDDRRRLPRPSSKSQKKAGTDDVNVTDSVLASCLALSCVRHSPTMSLGEKANSPDAAKSRIYEYPRKDSNLQPLAPEANALSN